MMISVVNGGENPLVNGSVRLLASDVVYQNGTVISSVPASAVASFGPIQSNQAIPVTVTMTVDSTINCPGENNTQFFISLQLIASDESSGAKVSTLFNTTLNCKPFGSSSPYRFTFLGYDGTIQYAAVIPPAKPCSGRVLGCPLLFSTHGASVDAASPTWTGAYQAQDNAWILLPTNRGAFGFDWQVCFSECVLLAVTVW